MPSAEEITVSVTAAAIAVSRDLSPDDAALWGAIFSQLGDTITTISIAKQNAATQQSAKANQQPAQTQTAT